VTSVVERLLEELKGIGQVIDRIKEGLQKKDNLGQSMASGVYFYALQAGKFTATRRMLIIR